MSARIRLIATVLVLATAGSGAWWLLRPAVLRAPATADDVLYWYDPMRPEVHFDKAGKSPFMDMDLVPKRRKAAASGGVTIDPRIRQDLGIRTARVLRASFAPRLTVTGAVAVDERRIFVVAARAAGWVEALDVRALGDPVRRGERIAGIYSPEILAAQQELLLALRTGDSALEPAARRRLQLLGVPATEVERIVRNGAAERQVGIPSPADGVVTALHVRQGSGIDTGTPIATVADLSQVWVLAEVPESRSGWLAAGQGAEVVTAGVTAGLRARIDYLHPEIDPRTRTVRVRLVLSNQSMRLRPGMSARVVLQGPAREALLVPSESLIRSGERTVVIVTDAGGRFRPVNVASGEERDGRTEILSGLAAGDEVVVSGQFLIDSEANLIGALGRLGSGAATGDAGRSP